MRRRLLAQHSRTHQLRLHGDSLLQAQAAERGVESAGFERIDRDSLFGQHRSPCPRARVLRPFVTSQSQWPWPAASSCAIFASAAASRSSSAASTVAEMRPIVISDCCLTLRQPLHGLLQQRSRSGEALDRRFQLDAASHSPSPSPSFSSLSSFRSAYSNRSPGPVPAAHSESRLPPRRCYAM